MWLHSLDNITNVYVDTRINVTSVLLKAVWPKKFKFLLTYITGPMSELSDL